MDTYDVEPTARWVPYYSPASVKRDHQHDKEAYMPFEQIEPGASDETESMLEPGTYVVGDPEKLLGDHVVAYDIVNKFKEPHLLSIHGAILWGAPLGGTFEDQNGIKYKGRSIAVIPTHLVDDPHAEEDATIITCEEPLLVSSKDGVIRINEIVIVTSQPEELGNGHDEPNADEVYFDPPTL